MRRQQGFTLAEVLIALAVIGFAFGALALVQVTNLRATVSARLLTDTKAAANVVLEELMAQVLATRTVGGELQFDFNDYYWSCPTPVSPPPGALRVVTPRERFCTGTRTIGNITVDHSIRGESGVLGEGVLTISVTARHNQGGQTLTLGDRITCYDIYPSPTATAPAPCPTPTATGGGRP